VLPNLCSQKIVKNLDKINKRVHNSIAIGVVYIPAILIPVLAGRGGGINDSEGVRKCAV
jgi:hypothetical protein